MRSQSPRSDPNPLYAQHQAAGGEAPRPSPGREGERPALGTQRLAKHLTPVVQSQPTADHPPTPQDAKSHPPADHPPDAHHTGSAPSTRIGLKGPARPRTSKPNSAAKRGAGGTDSAVQVRASGCRLYRPHLRTSGFIARPARPAIQPRRRPPGRIAGTSHLPPPDARAHAHTHAHTLRARMLNAARARPALGMSRCGSPRCRRPMRSEAVQPPSRGPTGFGADRATIAPRLRCSTAQRSPSWVATRKPLGRTDSSGRK